VTEFELGAHAEFMDNGSAFRLKSVPPSVSMNDAALGLYELPAILILKRSNCPYLTRSRTVEAQMLHWRLDRLGRSLKDLVQKVEDLQQRQVGFRSLHESIDTTSSVGKFQFHVFSALAEFERDLIRDRTMAGLRAARARGRLGGRPRRMTPEQVKMASHLMQDPAIDIKEIVRTLGVSRSTLYHYVGPNGESRLPGLGMPTNVPAQSLAG
jgi:hypothetical protein